METSVNNMAQRNGVFSVEMFVKLPVTVQKHLFHYRATRMHSADYAIAKCLSVCPSVTRWYSVVTAEHILNFFNRQVAPPSDG